MTRVFDISDPHNAKEVYTERIGDQINMLSQSWDGKRVYVIVLHVDIPPRL